MINPRKGTMKDVSKDPISEMIEARKRLREELQENKPQAERAIATRQVAGKKRRSA